MIDATLPLEAGKYYQVAVIGLVAEINEAVFEVDSSAVGEGMSRVHASPDAPAVDVAVADGPVLFGELSFPDASDCAVVESMSFDLQVQPAGTEDVALDLPGVAFEEGMVYDIFAMALWPMVPPRGAFMRRSARIGARPKAEGPSAIPFAERQRDRTPD